MDAPITPPICATPWIEPRCRRPKKRGHTKVKCACIAALATPNSTLNTMALGRSRTRLIATSATLTDSIAQV